MLDVKHLAWLAEIIELGSMSQAAKKLNVTQPTLSRAIQILESQAGSKLLERERYGVRATELGLQLYETATKIGEARSQVQETINLWQSGREHELRIGVGTMLASTVMGDFFTGTIDRPPKYGLRVIAATVSRLIELINSDELDVVLAPENVNLFRDDLVPYQLLPDQLALFTGSQNRSLTGTDPVGADMFSKQHWLSVGALSGISGTNEEVFRLLGMSGIPATISFTGAITMAVQIMRKTNAVCVLPRELVGLSEAMAGIREVRIEKALPQRNIAFWSRRKDKDRTNFIDLRRRLTEYFNELRNQSRQV